MTQNQIAYAGLVEEARSNLAKETETARANKANETETNRWHLATETETNRANVARENETNRSNLAQEQETKRANEEREKETNRSNLAKEDEEHRSNWEQEQIEWAKLDEENRKNLEQEKIQKEQQQIAKDIAELEARTKIQTAQIAAQVERYTAQLNANTQKWLKLKDAQISTSKNKATVYATKYRAAVDKSIAAANQLIEALKRKDDVMYKKASLQLQKQQQAIDQMYKLGQIKNGAWQAANGTLEAILKGITIGGKYGTTK